MSTQRLTNGQRPRSDTFLRYDLMKIVRPMREAAYFHDDKAILAEYDQIYAILLLAAKANDGELRLAISYADAELEQLAPTIYPKYVQPQVRKLGLVDVSEFRAALAAARIK